MNSREFSDINELVSRYEEMHQSNSVSFLNERAFESLLDYYEENGLLEDAFSVINYALEQYPFSAYFLIRKANLHFDDSNLEEAHECLDKAETLDASELEIYLLRAEILSLQGEYSEALDLLESKLQMANEADRSEIHLSIASVHEDTENFSRVFDALKKALHANPKNAEALDRMWLCVELSEKYEESIVLHQSLVDKDPYSHLAWYNLGHAHFSLENYQNAVTAYEFAYVIFEKFEFAYRDCGEALIRLKEYRKAIKCYEEALDHVRPDADIYIQIGECHLLLGDYSKAKDYYLKALKLDAHSFNAYYKLGIAYTKEEKWVSALPSFKKAHKLNDKCSECLLEMGRVHFHLGDYDQANKYFRKATDKAPEENNKWVAYCCFLLDIEAFEEALEVLEEAEIYTSGADLDYCKAICLFLLGHRKAAFNFLQMSLSNNFELHSMLFGLMPELKEDAEVLELIESYRKDNS